MKKAQPKLNQLEKKYANKTDQQSMMMKSNEMMAIYKEYKIYTDAPRCTEWIEKNTSLKLRSIGEGEEYECIFGSSGSYREQGYRN